MNQNLTIGIRELNKKNFEKESNLADFMSRVNAVKSTVNSLSSIDYETCYDLLETLEDAITVVMEGRKRISKHLDETVKENRSNRVAFLSKTRTDKSKSKSDYLADAMARKAFKDRQSR